MGIFESSLAAMNTLNDFLHSENMDVGLQFRDEMASTRSLLDHSIAQHRVDRAAMTNLNRLAIRAKQTKRTYSQGMAIHIVPWRAHLHIYHACVFCLCGVLLARGNTNVHSQIYCSPLMQYWHDIVRQHCITVTLHHTGGVNFCNHCTLCLIVNMQCVVPILCEIQNTNEFLLTSMALREA